MGQKMSSHELALDCAIMIVGAGPAGISTWLHLQMYAPELAEHSIVIEKAVFPRDKLCAGILVPWSADVLAHLEVELDIPCLFVSDLEFRSGAEIDRLQQPNFFRVVQRMDFDHVLAKTAANRGLELHEDELFVDATGDRCELIIRTNKRSYRVQALVGADGALSTVRRKMMPPQKPHLASMIQIFASVDPRGDTDFNERRMVFDFTPINEGLQGYVWHVPCLKDDTPSVVHGICDFRVCPDQPRAGMKRIFSRELQCRNIHRDPKSWFCHPIRWLSDDDIISQPNVLLAGDAAGIEPAFGGGVHLALSYGEVAAHAIIDAFQDNDFSFHDYKQRIQSHSVGKFIAKCTHLALEMYGGRMNPLDAAREVFTAPLDPLLSVGLLDPKHVKGS